MNGPEKNGLRAKPQEGWVANRPSVWVGKVNHFRPFPTPGPWKLATQQLVLRFSFSGSRKEEWSAFRVTSGEDFYGILPRRFLTAKPQGIPGPPGAPGTEAVGGLCAVPITLLGGYLGTRQSGKHLIATLRRGM